MASTFTTNKNIEKPAYNDYASNPTGWSGPINSDWDVIDSGFGGVLSLNATGSVGTVNLSITQTQNLIFLISGVMTGNAIYTLPLNASGALRVAGQFVVKNSTTGAFTVTFAPISGGGTTVAIPQGETVCIYSEGTNIAFADNPTSYINAAFAARSVLAGTAMTGGGALSANVTITADQATDANWRSNVANKLLNPNAVWSAMSETALTDGASIAWDMSTGFDFLVTLGGNRAMANPTNTKVGQKGRLIIQQDATGSRIVTWGTSFEFANGTAPTLSTTASAKDYLYYDVRSATEIFISLAGRAVA
tara:strand:- start:71 stop:988 length:918 start_codon:yes stop_codon:yes gene_type:complete